MSEVSGASERANGRASDSVVLQSVFLVALAHSAVVARRVLSLLGRMKSRWVGGLAAVDPRQHVLAWDAMAEHLKLTIPFREMRAEVGGGWLLVGVWLLVGDFCLEYSDVVLFCFSVVVLFCFSGRCSD